MSKIAANLIVRDSAQTIEACLRSLNGHVDFFNITDTGSKDDTKAIVERVSKELAIPLSLTDFEWCDDFSAARNFNLAHVPADCDWWVWVDSDDTLQGENLHGLADKMQPQFGALWFPYDYARDEFGNRTTLYERERLMRSSVGWIWQGRLHETVSAMQQTQFCRTDTVMLIHNHLAGVPRQERNMRILNAMHQDNPDDRRVWLYFGHQLFANQEWLDAAQWYLKFGGDGQGVPLERFQALCYASKALREVRDIEQAVKVALMAVETCPQYIDGYLELAHAYSLMNDGDKALHWLKLSENKELIKEPPAVIFLNPLDYTFNKYCLLADIWLRKQDIQQTLYWLNEAVKVRPVAELKVRLAEMQELWKRSEVVKGLKYLCVELLNKGEVAKLDSVLQAAPYWFKETPDYQEMRAGNHHYREALVKGPPSPVSPQTQELHWNAVLERLQALPDASRVLVWACGDGTFVRLLRQAGVNAFGTERDAEKAHIAKQVIGEHFVTRLKSAKGWDVVVHVRGPESVDKPEEHLEELRRHAKHVILTTSLPRLGSPPTMRRRVFSQTDIEELVTSKPGRRIINLHTIRNGSEEDGFLCEYDHEVPDNKFFKFFLGQGLEHWSPDTINTIGCGGSETAVAWTARELAKHRCLNIVYAMDNQAWDGVLYRPWQQARMDNPCNVLVSSRIPEVVDQPIAAKQKWLWVHDVDLWDRLTPQRASQFDVIWLLSRWHLHHFQRTYPWLKDAPVKDILQRPSTFEDDADYQQRVYSGIAPKHLPTLMVMGNGIDTARFKELKGERVPYRFIWVSSPDRGLEQVLDLWPKIKERLPEASLRIFYGWEYFDHALHIPGQRELKAKIRRLLKQPGIEWAGRVSQPDLAREMMQADAWLYPPGNGFRETCCISGIELQAAGVVCFYRESGALGETVGSRGIPVTQENVLDKLELLKDREACQAIRDKGREWAMQQDWSIIADAALKVYEDVDGAGSAKV